MAEWGTDPNPNYEFVPTADEIIMLMLKNMIFYLSSQQLN